MIDLADWIAETEGEERHALIIKDDYWRPVLAKWKAAYDLVASETTLIVEKVNGEWPEWAREIVQNNTPRIVLDALLAQRGTTK